ncbi:unnamed protein product, partial [Soboliphyme baturini]|uniref:Neur_chan_LBD domain-containing protein n=1 Tax=Soboliphyme baturini TaxID=241478 RepID=A0A183J0N5_9BILA
EIILFAGLAIIEVNFEVNVDHVNFLSTCCRIRWTADRHMLIPLFFRR